MQSSIAEFQTSGSKLFKHVSDISVDVSAVSPKGLIKVKASTSPSPENLPQQKSWLGGYDSKGTGSSMLSPKSPSVHEKVDRKPHKRTHFGLWAQSLAFTAVLCGLPAACCCYIFAQYSSSATIYDWFAAFYALGASLAVLVSEAMCYRSRNGPSFARGVFYILLCVCAFASVMTWVLGVCLLLSGIFNLVAWCRRGSENRPHTMCDQKPQPAASRPARDIRQSLGQVRTRARLCFVGANFGLRVFVFCYFAINCYVFYNFFMVTYRAMMASPADKRLSIAAPFAKGFGWLLDLNCGIMILPVCRSLLKLVYNCSTANQGCVSKCLRAILLFCPIDHNIAFHKLVAWVVLYASFGHCIAHAVNYSFAPTATKSAFGLWPFYTGGVLVFCMLMLYSSAAEMVRRHHFEIFWANHHWFIVFFAFLLVHHHLHYNLDFIYFFAVPGLVYLVERVVRMQNAKQEVVVLSVTVMRPGTLSLEFAKSGVFSTPFKEGQYVFLQAPSISRLQWHPFTISSAPDEKTVTVHIKDQGEGTWTHSLLTMFTRMGPTNASYFQLTRQREVIVPGKIFGPDGCTPLLRMDGPYSAPTQHMREYRVCMVIGAGIGVTPVAATLKSVVFHRWKYSLGATFPEHAYFFWVCSYHEIDSFRWLIRVLKDAQDEVYHMRSLDNDQQFNKTFECHIWITSPPAERVKRWEITDDVGFWGLPRQDNLVEKRRVPFTEEDIYRAMKSQAGASKATPTHAQMADIFIYSGRPNWQPQFDKIAAKHPRGDIGVAFCGNPAIANDLDNECIRASRLLEEGLFVLHKENF